MVETAVHGKMQLSSSQQQGLVFGCAFLAAGIVLSTIVFPFWHLIREDVFENVVILTNDDGTCYVETIDAVPKIIENYIAELEMSYIKWKGFSMGYYCYSIDRYFDI